MSQSSSESEQSQSAGAGDSAAGDSSKGKTAPESRQRKPEAGKARGGDGSGPVWLALLFSLIAIVAVGWLAWQQGFDDTNDALTGLRVGLGAELESAAGERDAIREEVGELNTALERLESGLDDLAGQPGAEAVLASGLEPVRRSLDDLDARIARIESSTGRRLDQVERRIDEAVAELEAAGGRLGQVDRELARQIGLIETRAIVVTGRERLELAGDVASARRAWRRAIERLERLDDPRAGSAQRALVAELERLEAWNAPAWAERVGRLQALAETVSEWPARPDTAAAPPEESAQTGWWAQLRNSLGELVRVRPREGLGPKPVEVEQARSEVEQLLIGASLAAARGDGDLLEQLARSAGERIERFFDPQAAAVVRARQQLAELSRAPESHPLPEVGDGLLALERLIGDSR